MLDPDRKETTWEHCYKHIYLDSDWSFWALLDFNVRDNKGCITWKKSEEISWADENKKIYKDFYEKYPKFKISGDADWGMKRTDIKRIIENPDKEMHRFQNFSLIPVGGGMNNKKGGFGYKDRFDKFLFYLSQYWEQENKWQYVKEFLWCNLPSKDETTIGWLMDFLDLFSNIKVYCSKIYLIPPDFTEKIIESGKKDYETERYCRLAIEYWNIRNSLLKRRLSDEEQKLIDANINDGQFI